MYYFVPFLIGIMIRLFKEKEKLRKIAESSDGRAPVKKLSAGELRLHKGFLSYD